MAEEKQQKQEVGALWVRTAKNGSKFLSGKINGTDIVRFFRDKKTEKHPDIVLYLSDAPKQATQ